MSVVGRAIWFVESHLSGKISHDMVAEHVQVSPFHLSRAFNAFAGCSLSSYVRGRRLSEAAIRLAAGAPDILHTALSAGYGSHEAFTRAFSAQFGTTPEQVRSAGTVEQLVLVEAIRMGTERDHVLAPPRIQEREKLLVFGLMQRFPCRANSAIPSQWDCFLPHMGHIDGQQGKDAYGVIVSAGTDTHDYLCGVEVSEAPVAPRHFSTLLLHSALYAVFDYFGHVAEIAGAWRAIWDDALQRSGLEPTHCAAFERYGEDFDRDLGVGGMEIWLPISPLTKMRGAVRHQSNAYQTQLGDFA